MNRPAYLCDDDDIDRVVEEERQRRDALDRVNGASQGRMAFSSSSSPSMTSAYKPSASIELVPSAAITPTPVQWLWPGWLAEGRLQILAGAPGAGKTTIALSLAAAVSAGRSWPDGTLTQVGSVVIWSGEDDPGDTLVPRLAAADADLNRVFIVGRAREDSAARPFDPARDMPALADAIKREREVKLVVIDPLAMVAVKDSHRNAETRRDLQPVVDLCRETGAAVLGIHHLAKGTAGREPVERLIGSIAFAAVARVVLIATKLPSHGPEAGERRVLIRAKSNIGPDQGGFAYGLTQTELGNHPGIFASCVAWGEVVEGTAREVLAEAEERDEEQSPRDEAVEFLRSHLGNGPNPANEIHAAARKEGISSATLRRAKSELRIRSVRIGFGKGSFAQWEIPSETPYMLTTPHRCSLKSVSTYEGSEHLCAPRSEPDDREEVEF
jgi:putative DNA primase/helicase